MNVSSSPRLANKLNHKELYKSPFRISNINQNSPGNLQNQDESPSWRNAYKKRCFDEFKKSRQKLINRFRNCQIDQNKKTKFKDYLEEELEKICLLEAKTESISVDEAIEIYKQIQYELLPKSLDDLDDQQIEEILKSDEMEEKLNQDTILFANSNSSIVFCPICQKEMLIQQNSNIVCKNALKNNCHFKIDCLETNLNLDQLRIRLENAVKQHQCNEVPSFEFKTKETMNQSDHILLNQLSTLPSASCFLLMSCENCLFMQSII